jgi:hypothetical protein
MPENRNPAAAGDGGSTNGFPSGTTRVELTQADCFPQHASARVWGRRGMSAGHLHRTDDGAAREAGRTNDGSTVAVPVSADRPPHQTVVIVVSPATNADGQRAYSKRGQPFNASNYGRIIVTAIPTPFLDAARVLAAKGVDPAAIIVMRHQGANYDALRSTVGAAAKLRVNDTETGRPRFSRFVPWNAGAPAGQGAPHIAPNEVEATKGAAGALASRHPYGGPSVPVASPISETEPAGVDDHRPDAPALPAAGGTQ